MHLCEGSGLEEMPQDEPSHERWGAAAFNILAIGLGTVMLLNQLLA